MVTKQKNFQLVRGDSLAFSFQVTGLTSALSSVVFSCKRTVKDDTYVFQKTLDDGIEVSEDIYTVRIAPEDTADLNARRYVYDLEIAVDQDVYTLMMGNLDLIADVTRR